MLTKLTDKVVLTSFMSNSCIDECFSIYLADMLKKRRVAERLELKLFSEMPSA